MMIDRFLGSLESLVEKEVEVLVRVEVCGKAILVMGDHLKEKKFK